MKHTFAVCAYGDSPYLEDCLKSLKEQTVPSEIIVCTSTPSEYIRRLADACGLPLIVRTGEPGIARDWNFAYAHASGELVTIAHQDDIYRKDYAKVLQETKEKYPDMSVFMTASETIKNGRIQPDGSVERIKKMLRLPLRLPGLCDRTVFKKAVITFGNPVICPSCTYDRTLCGENIFPEQYSFVLDWETLYRLAEQKGRWVCVEQPLICYRVHPDAATGEAIRNRVREKEESEMFGRTLPAPLSEWIRKGYQKSYDAYKE